MSKKLRKIPKKDLLLKGGFWFLPQHDFMLSAALCQHYVYVLATTAALKRWSKFSSLECDINYVTKYQVVSTVACYLGGPRFKSRQGREFINL